MELNDYATSFLGLGSLLIAFLVYLHGKNQRRDSWLHSYTSVYEAFWDDDEMREIRAWISNPDTFADAKEVFIKRKQQYSEREGTIELTRDEYIYVDKLDRFLSLMTRMVVLGRQFKESPLWGQNLWEFWLRECSQMPEFAWYIRAFWTDLYAHCREKGYVDASND